MENLYVNSGAGLKLFSSPVATVQMNIRGAYSGRSRPSEGGPGLQKIFFGLRASVWSNNKGWGKAPGSATGLFSQWVIYFEGLMTVIFISSQHFTKATKVLQKGKGMVELVNQWR